MTDALEMEKTDRSEILTLENNCMICESESGDIFDAISRLLTINELKHPEKPFDHILVENSAGSDPRFVKNLFKQALRYDFPLLKKVKLMNMITIVDSESFLECYQCTDLYQRSRGRIYDEMLQRVEYGDVILLNKIDLKTDKIVDKTLKVINILNPIALSMKCEYCNVNLKQILNAPSQPHSQRKIPSYSLAPLKKKRGYSTFVYVRKTEWKKAFQEMEEEEGPIWEKGMKMNYPYQRKRLPQVLQEEAEAKAKAKEQATTVHQDDMNPPPLSPS